MLLGVRLREHVVPPVLDSRGLVVPFRLLVARLEVHVSPDLGGRGDETVRGHASDGPFESEIQRFLLVPGYTPLPHDTN